MEKIKNTVKAIIFDMDGTIIKTEHLWKEATANTLRTRGVTIFTPEHIKILESLSGIGLLQSAQVIKKEFNLQDSIEVIAQSTKQNAFELFKSEVEFIDGFEAFHRKLQSFLIPTSIATNADPLSLHLLNQKMKFDQFFGTNMYSIGVVDNKAKPDPAIFLHAAKQLNAQPYECIVFEDSLFGFQAAKAAGMTCIAIKNELNKQALDQVAGAIDSYHEAELALHKIISSK